MAAQECDCNFATSGDTVFISTEIDYLEKNTIKPPLEKRGVSQDLWIWEPADYTKNYLITADIARGDGKDYSTFQIIDIESFTQVGEYRGQISTTDFGNLLVGIATEYNNALLAPENSSIGWSTIQTILDRGYQNLYYSPKGNALNVDTYFDPYMDHSKMTPGYTMSSSTRPIAVSKFQEAVRDKGLTLQSSRTVEEMKVFIWKNGRPEAQSNYNDDLIMAMAIACFLRDSSFKLRQSGMEMTKSMLNSITSNSTTYSGGYSTNTNNNPYKIDNPYSGGDEDISWLL